ncbi:MAG: hypothetical protein M1817_000270 [Caeruleum heppii]|nr:MAG: hypothetical protein M1817_000270 [Caeruleum heppii]
MFNKRKQPVQGGRNGGFVGDGSPMVQSSSTTAAPRASAAQLAARQIRSVRGARRPQNLPRPASSQQPQSFAFNVLAESSGGGSFSFQAPEIPSNPFASATLPSTNTFHGNMFTINDVEMADDEAVPSPPPPPFSLKIASEQITDQPLNESPIKSQSIGEHPVEAPPIVEEPSVVTPPAVESSNVGLSVVEPSPVEPSVIKPSAIEPPLVDPSPVAASIFAPKAIVPPVVERPVIQKPAVEPAFVEPAVVKQTTVEPAMIEPAVVEPAMIEPAAVTPSVIKPAILEPAVVKPAVLEPAVVKPSVFKPAIVEPAVVESAAVGPPKPIAPVDFEMSYRLAELHTEFKKFVAASAPFDDLFPGLKVYMSERDKIMARSTALQAVPPPVTSPPIPAQSPTPTPPADRSSTHETTSSNTSSPPHPASTSPIPWVPRGYPRVFLQGKDMSPYIYANFPRDMSEASESSSSPETDRKRKPEAGDLDSTPYKRQRRSLEVTPTKTPRRRSRLPSPPSPVSPAPAISSHATVRTASPSPSKQPAATPAQAPFAIVTPAQATLHKTSPLPATQPAATPVPPPPPPAPPLPHYLRGTVGTPVYVQKGRVIKPHRPRRCPLRDYRQRKAAEVLAAKFEAEDAAEEAARKARGEEEGQQAEEEAGRTEPDMDCQSAELGETQRIDGTTQDFQTDEQSGPVTSVLEQEPIDLNINGQRAEPRESQEVDGKPQEVKPDGPGASVNPGQDEQQNQSQDAEDSVQTDLTVGGQGEEQDETLLEVRVKAQFFSDGKWCVGGVGPLRVLKNRTTGTTRILVRNESRGSVVLNAGLLAPMTYDLATTGTVRIPEVTPTGLKTWMVKMRDPEVATKLTRLLEAEKLSTGS